MNGCKEIFRFVFLAVLVQWACSLSVGETWHLEKGKDWREVSERSEDKYLLAVSEIKKLVNTGQSKAVESAVRKLKEDFPEVAGPDLDIFVKAEKFYAKGKLTKAFRAYDNLMSQFPESKLYDVALGRQFAIGTAYLTGRKKQVLKFIKIRGYSEGIKIMDKIIDRVGDAPIAIKAARSVAESFEKRGKFEQAYERWSEISSSWPTGQTGKDALLGMARCKHAAYRGPGYDVSDLVSARSYYENFKLRYPEEARKYDIASRLEQIREQLAYKQYNVAEYYKRTGSIQSSNIYSQMVIDDWPGSTASKRAKEIMSENLSKEKEEK